jgi:hypothetical protein
MGFLVDIQWLVSRGQLYVEGEWGQKLTICVPRAKSRSVTGVAFSTTYSLIQAIIPDAKADVKSLEEYQE